MSCFTFSTTSFFPSLAIKTPVPPEAGKGEGVVYWGARRSVKEQFRRWKLVTADPRSPHRILTAARRRGQPCGGRTERGRGRPREFRLASRRHNPETGFYASRH